MKNIVYKFNLNYLLRVIFIIIISTSNVKSSETKWEVWHDDDYEFTYIDAFGSISKADLIALTIKHDECDKLTANFYITSFDREIAEIGYKFNVNITETPHDGNSWQEYVSEIYINYHEQINDSVVYVLAFDYKFETQDWINRLDEFGPFYFFLNIDTHKEEQLDPSKYFEHTSNLWDFSSLQPTLEKAYRNCRLEIYKDNMV